MLNVVVVPSQVTVLFVKCGVTVMVAVTGVVPLFTPLNEAMAGQSPCANSMHVKGVGMLYVT